MNFPEADSRSKFSLPRTSSCKPRNTTPPRLPRPAVTSLPKPWWWCHAPKWIQQQPHWRKSRKRTLSTQKKKTKRKTHWLYLGCFCPCNRPNDCTKRKMKRQQSIAQRAMVTYWHIHLTTTGQEKVKKYSAPFMSTWGYLFEVKSWHKCYLWKIFCSHTIRTLTFPHYHFIYCFSHCFSPLASSASHSSHKFDHLFRPKAKASSNPFYIQKHLLQKHHQNLYLGVSSPTSCKPEVFYAVFQSLITEGLWLLNLLIVQNPVV